MLGYAHAAGFRDGPRPDLATIARYFSVPAERLDRAALMLETAERPEILLLQNPDRDAKVGAAVLFSSVWSAGYRKVGTPYGRIHRDFHYQMLFAALSGLAEIGCDRIRVENPMSGHSWRRDAYICLLEATGNVRSNVSKVAVYLEQDSYDPRMPEEVDGDMSKYDLQKHRPVGIAPYISDGLNMRTVFVEKAGAAMRAARGLSPSDAAG